jgi:UDP-N-acetyl-D-mannosaminuronic acid dehydrogenase
MRVCVVGLGYVGLTLAVYLSSKGLRVHGIELNDKIINSLKRKEAHFFEEHFNAELVRVIDNGNFTFSKDYINATDNFVYIITVGTPLTHDGLVNVQSIKTVCDKVRNVLKKGDTVILRSTVKVGFTRDLVKRELDLAGVSYHLGYCPERTLEGSALIELASLPQIISGIDHPSLSAIHDFFKPICSEIISLDSVEEAEIAKLLSNAERDLVFAFANEAALICDAKGINAHRVIDAANCNYPRSSIRKPGLVGGPCLEKDPYILTESFSSSDYMPRLFNSSRAVHQDVVSISLNRVFDRVDEGASASPKKAAILGFAFKGSPPTNDMRGSLVCTVIQVIKSRYPNIKLVGHDYLVDFAEIENFGVSACGSVSAAVEGADVVILQNNHAGYQKENWDSLQELMNPSSTIYDFWAQLAPLCTKNDVSYLCLGNLSND